MLGFVFHRKRRTFGRPARTMLVISIGFKKVPIEDQPSEFEERANEMQDHPAFARSKRFVPKEPPESEAGVK